MFVLREISTVLLRRIQAGKAARTARLGLALLVVVPLLAGIGNEASRAATPQSGARPTSAATTTRATTTVSAPAVTPSAPIVGELVNVTGVVPGTVARPVQLQRLTAGIWRTVATGDSNSRGGYLLRSPAPSKVGTHVHVRVLAPRATISSHTYASAVTPVAIYTTVAQNIAVTAPGVQTTGQGIPVTVQSTPARTGRGTVVQRKIGTAWVDVAKGAEDTYGITRVTVPAAKSGTYVVRAISASFRLAAAQTSTSNTTLVSSSLLSPTDVTVIPGPATAHLAWTAGAGSGLSGYRVYSAPTVSGPWTKVGVVLDAAARSTTVSGLTNGKTTYLQVRSVAGAAEAPARRTVAIIPLAIDEVDNPLATSTKTVEPADLVDAIGLSNGNTLATLRPAFATVAVGDYLLVKPSALIPDGMFAHVVTVTMLSSGSQQTELEQAPLSDVFKDPSYDFSADVVPQPTASGSTTVRRLPNGSYQVKESAAGSAFDCKTNNGVPLTADQVWDQDSPIPIEITFANFHAHQTYDSVSRYLRYSITGDVTTTIKVQAKLGVNCELSTSWARQHRLLHQPIGSLGGVPIVLDVAPDFNFDVSEAGGVSISQTRHWSFWVQKSQDTGITFGHAVTADPATFQSVKDLTAEIFAGADFELSGGGGLGSANAKVGLAISLGGQASVTLKPGCADLSLAVHGGFSIFLTLWDHRWSKELATFDLWKGTPKTWCFGPPIIKNTMPAATIGVSYEGHLGTADDRSGSWQITSGTLPAGLELDPSSGHVFGVPSGPQATVTFGAKFTDDSGRSATAQISMSVVPTPLSLSDLFGKIARTSSGDAWYVDKRGGTHHIADGGTYDCLVAQGITVVAASPTDVSSLPAYEQAACVRAAPGNIVRTSDGDAYLINADWTRSWIPDGDSYDCLQANGHTVVAAPRYYVMDLTQAADITFNCVDTAAARGTVVKADDGSSYYVDLRGDRHAIPDGGTYECLIAQNRPLYQWVIPHRMISRFGDDWEPAACVRANPGDIIRNADGDSYLVNADFTKSWIPDGGTFECLQANGHALVDNVPRYYISDLTSAANVTFSCYDPSAVKGKVVRGSDGASWYIDKRGGKHWIPDGGTYDCIAAQTGGAYAYVVPSEWLTQTQYENAQCVRASPGNIIKTNDGDAYILNGDWTRSWIPTASSYTCYRAEGRAVVSGVPRYYIDDLTQVGNAVYGNGNCIVRQPDGTAWYVNDQGNREWVPDSPTWDCEVGRGTPVVNVTAAMASSIGEVGWHYCLNQANLRGKIVRNMDTGNAWLVDGNGNKTWLPDEFAYNCRVRQGYQVVNTHWQQYIDSFPGSGSDYCFDVATFENKLVKGPDGAVYFVDEQGVRHWVPGSTYSCMVGRFGDPHITTNQNYVNALTSGDWAVCGDSLYPGQNMDRGQWLSSGNGYTLIMQYDGNLVLYGPGGALWASNTAGTSARKVRFDGNGALSIQDSSGNWIKHICGSWSSGATRFVVQGDSNLVLYRNSTALWSRSTALCNN